MSDNPLPLRDYQIKDLGFHIGAKKSLNLSDPGTGKTPVVCMFAYYHWARRQKKTLWVMPKSLLKKNKDEMVRFTGFDPDDVTIMHSDFKPLTKSWNGPTFTRQKKVKVKTGRRGPDGEEIIKWEFVDEEACDLIAAAKDAKVFICTFSFMRSHWKRMLETHPDIDVLLVDELHMGYGTNDSAQTESLYFVNRKVSQFIGMTGTLINGRLDTAYPAIHVIEPRYYGSHAGFLAEHAGFIDDYGRVHGWVNVEKLQKILAAHSIRHTFQEVYGEEPVVFFHELIEVGEKCREEYDKFHAQAMLELEDGEILDGSLPGVNLIRARQILAHPETLKLAKGEPTGKDERLRIFAAEGQKMIVFASLKPEQQRCLKLLTDLGLRAALINSDVSGAQRSKIDEAFRNGELDAIVASGPTASVGYNWEMADHVVFVSVDYQDVNVLQAYRRASRGTRTTPLRVTFLEYENTIDGRVYQILTTKSELANQVDATRAVLKFAA